MLKTALTIAALATMLTTALPAAAGFTSAAPGLWTLDTGAVAAERRGRSGCDTRRDILEHPECRR